MACVVKQPGSRYWIAAFYDASAKQHRRTTRETDRKRAQAVADQYERAAKRKGSPQRIRQIFSEFYRTHFGEDLPFVSVRDYAAQWLTSRKGETSALSHNLYRIAIDRFLAFLDTNADRALDEITRAQIAAFRDAQLAAAAPATVNSYLKVVKMLFRAARRDGVLLEDPTESVKAAKQDTTFERRPFALGELRSVLAIADPEWQSLIKFGLYTGQRLGDLATLTWAQIDLEHGEIRLTARKTGKRLLIPIAQPLREHLLSGAGGDDPRAPVHPRSAALVASSRGQVSALSNQFGELLVAAGLRHQLREPGGKGVGRSGRRTGIELSFHSLRHTAVSLLKDAGVPDAVAMALVGHESTAMSHRYTHVGKEALSRATQSLPVLP
jgi:integrase